jgi:RimJ/RimL family protein N-acetyltransferase
MLHDLPDGTRVRIRPVEPDDKPLLAAAMAQLSRESIRRRFLAAKPSLSAAELRYLTEVDGVDHIALVSVLDDEPGRLAAVARCVRVEPGATTADFAIVVGDALQGRGLGSVLARALADAARAVGIRRFSATTLADNVAVRRLMDSLAVRVEHRVRRGGVYELVAELDGSDAAEQRRPLAA